MKKVIFQIEKPKGNALVRDRHQRGTQTDRSKYSESGGSKSQGYELTLKATRRLQGGRHSSGDGKWQGKRHNAAFVVRKKKEGGTSRESARVKPEK